MSLFQRIRTPFGNNRSDDASAPQPRPRGVGELLRERREELGLALGDIGETLRIRPAYLAALEQGHPQELPGSTYAVGFVRAYARHLGLDAEWVLQRYKAESADANARPDLSLPVPLGERSLPGGPILLVALILAICGYGTWYYLSTGERSRPPRVAAVPAELQSPPPIPGPPQDVPATGPPADQAASAAPSAVSAVSQGSTSLPHR